MILKQVVVCLCLIVAVACGGGDSSPTAPTPTPPTAPTPPPTPTPDPDLVVGSPTVDDNNPAVGATFTLSTTVRNDGEGASPATTLRYYRSTDATITTADTAEGTAAVAGLAASGSTSASVQLTAPLTAGTYYYGVCVDAVTDESNTTNNCLRWTPSFGPKSGLAKVEPAGSVLVVVVSCELGCRPGPGTRNGPTPVRGDGVQVAAGAPRSGVGAERRTWRRSSTPAPGAEAARALMRRGTSTSSRRTRPASDSPTTYAVARHCRSGSSARFPRAPRSANHRGAGRSPHT